MQLSVARIRYPHAIAPKLNSQCTEAHRSRYFSYKQPRQLFALHPGSPRPQLPFLYPSGASLPHGQILRLFSLNTRQKKFFKDTAKLSVRYTILIFLLTSSVSVLSLGILSERQERAFPSPHEWSLITRFRFRRGKWWQVPENNEVEGFTNWSRVYDELQHALIRLEDPNKDGAGLLEQEEGGILIPGVEKAGFDLSAKSEEWRQGYYEVLTGMAASAERLEGWVTEKSRTNVWAPEFVPSPSNPRPKAVLPGMPELPSEERRVSAADTPETFYLKIITSKGFTTHQRLSAAISYADWLSFKKLPDSAEEMYRWALDIAITGLHTRDTTAVIDRESGIFSSTAPKELLTPNIVYAATNLATFLAGQGRINAALPMFVSLLRARLSADEAFITTPRDVKNKSLIGTIISLLEEPEYPPVPPSGDEVFLRKESDRCEEAALKNYIGEILFATAASSVQRREGLSWVRDAVSTSKTAQSLDSVRNKVELRKKCEQCEEVGLEAWGKIMTYLAAEAHRKRDEAISGGLKGLLWKLWGSDHLSQDVKELADEEDGVTLRLNKLRKKMMREEYEEMDRKYARTFVF